MTLSTTSMSPRAQEIYDRSVALADGDGLPDWLDSGDDVLWLPVEKRATAMSFYAHEFGCRFIDVRCTRAWLRIDRSRIADVAIDLANEDPDDVGEEPIAYTWEDAGWNWSECAKTDPGAVGFWRCEQR